jgi:hypothetical protein
MSRRGNLMAARAEDFDAGSRWRDRLGEDQRDGRRRRVEDRVRRRVGLDQLRVGECSLRDERGGDRDNGDRKPPRTLQE